MARRVDRRSRAFYYSPRAAGIEPNPYHLDAMWAGIETGVPTVNGYSGAGLPGWSGRYDASVDGPSDRNRIGRALGEWASLNGVNPDKIAWIASVDRGTPPEPASRRPPTGSPDD